jgi:hypothetical protein
MSTEKTFVRIRGAWIAFGAFLALSAFMYVSIIYKIITYGP